MSDLWCDNCEESMDREGDNPAGVCDVCWNEYLADKALLDAMSDLTEEQVLQVNSIDPDTGNAELARRRLK